MDGRVSYPALPLTLQVQAEGKNRCKGKEVLLGGDSLEPPAEQTGLARDRAQETRRCLPPLT